MTVGELITRLMGLPRDMTVGSTNYYSEFGTVRTVEIWTCTTDPSYSSQPSYKGKKVVVINFDIDQQ